MPIFRAIQTQNVCACVSERERERLATLLCYIKICRSSLHLNFHWQLMALLLLRHALSVTDADGEEDASTFFSVSGIRTLHHFIFLSFSSWFIIKCFEVGLT